MIMLATVACCHSFADLVGVTAIISHGEGCDGEGKQGVKITYLVSGGMVLMVLLLSVSNSYRR